ncbi:MAG: M55 family metallopeptidase [Candidatus Dormiibacterota bacterium]
MKIYISCDMEGVAGLVDWQQVSSPGPEYEMGRRLLLAEVNAAIDGAMEAGADEFLVNDSHGAMQNLPPDEIHGQAEYLSGRHKTFRMMEGLDESFAAIFFIGYHGSVDGPSSVMSHSYTPATFMAAEINGTMVGEGGINALLAAHFQIPIVLVSGDQHTATQLEAICPGVTAAVVKYSVTRLAARNLHPVRAREVIKEAARSSLQRLASIAAPHFAPETVLRLRMRNADLAEVATVITDVRRISDTEIEVGGKGPFEVFRNFTSVRHIALALAQER